MTKADLVKQVADAIGPPVTRTECALAIDAFLDAVKDALARAAGIELRGFGTFKVRHRKPHMARNPRTGEPIEVPFRRVPVFDPSRLLRDRVNGGRIPQWRMDLPGNAVIDDGVATGTIRSLWTGDH